MILVPGVALWLWVSADRSIAPLSLCASAQSSAVYAESVVVDPRDADRAFAVAGRAVSRTAERRDCLIPSDDGLERKPPEFRFVDPFALSVDPQQPDTLYLGSAQGVYKSTDAGRSWQQRTDGITFSIGEADVGRVAVDPLRSDVLYVGGLGIFKSVDGAGTWAFVQNGIPLGYFPPAYGFAFDPRDTDIVYLATYRLFKTHDGAGLWEPSDNGLPGPVIAIAVNRADPDVVYAGTPVGIFVSLDAGVAWSPDGLTGHAVFAVLQDPADPANLLANTDAGLFRSGDGGATWSPLPTPFEGPAHDVSIAPSDAATLYAATDVGVYRSRDGGASWVSLGIDRRVPRQVPER